MRFPKCEDSTGLQPTKASKQSTTRQTLTKNGGWLSTKPASVKRKKATTDKMKPVKKIKAKLTKKAVPKNTAKRTKPPKKRTGTSMDVIELSSDDDEPDVPLLSLRQVEEPDTSDEEYEFEE